MRLLEVAWRSGGVLATALLIVGMSSLVACAPSLSEFTASHTVTVQVQDAFTAPVSNVLVNVWIVDMDMPGAERVPIKLGPASTDELGQVRFAYSSSNPPYVCGWEVWSSAGDVVLAQHPPMVSDNLSPNGYAVALVP